MTKPKIAIIGGGIAGLACAHRLIELQKENQSNFEVHLFENSSRLGGTIATEVKDGFVLEQGPDSFLSEKPWGVQLSKRLGIESEIIGTRNEYRKSFVVRKGKLHELPEGFYLIAPTRIRPFLSSPLFSLQGKMRMAAEFLLPKKNSTGDESIGSFIRRRFGREALDRVGQAMLAGIYSGDPDRLSLGATMPRFRELERNYGSVIRGLFVEAKKKKELSKASGPRYSLFLSFRNGMETLVQKLAQVIPHESIHLNSGLTKIDYDRSTNRWRLSAASSHGKEFDFVCLALPAFQAARLFSSEYRDLSEKLSEMVYESVATVNLVFKRSEVQHPLNGFGFVVPAIEKSPLVACSFSSVKFDHRAPKDFVLLRAFVGGAFGRNFFAMNDHDLIEVVIAELKQLLQIQREPTMTLLSRYASSMAQYQVGHRELVSEIKAKAKETPGLFLTGSSYQGAGIPDCIFDAEKQAEEIHQLARRSNQMVGSEW